MQPAGKPYKIFVNPMRITDMRISFAMALAATAKPVLEIPAGVG
jgi:hypothetical protein